MIICLCGEELELNLLIDRFTISTKARERGKPAKACPYCQRPRCQTCGGLVALNRIFCCNSCRSTDILTKKWQEENYRKAVSERMIGNQYTLGKTWTLSNEAKLNHSKATVDAIIKGQPAFQSYEELEVKEVLESRGFIHQYQFYSEYGTADNYHKRYHFNLDFADPVRKINIEIDGLSHDLEHIKEYDEFRDGVLVMNGWIVHRIYTKDISGVDEKSQIELIA
jgi:hypothetical protein